MPDFASTGTFRVDKFDAHSRLKGLEFQALEGHVKQEINEGVTLYVKHRPCWACDANFPAHSPEFTYVVETGHPWNIEAVSRQDALALMGSE